MFHIFLDLSFRHEPEMILAGEYYIVVRMLCLLIHFPRVFRVRWLFQSPVSGPRGLILREPKKRPQNNLLQNLQFFPSVAPPQEANDQYFTKLNIGVPFFYYDIVDIMSKLSTDPLEEFRQCETVKSTKRYKLQLAEAALSAVKFWWVFLIGTNF